MFDELKTCMFTISSMSSEPMSWVMDVEFSGSVGVNPGASLAFVTCWQAAVSRLLLLVQKGYFKALNISTHVAL